MCDKNIAKEEYEKLRNYLSRMKEFLEKGSSPQ